MAHIVALANQKGGVGKTTTAVNVGAYLASWGVRVLLVDMDPQANATSSLGIDKRSVQPSVYQVLIDRAPLTGAILLTKRLHLDLAPATPALAGAQVELVGLPARDLRLRDALIPSAEAYDVVLIDSPPSLGLLTVNALAAAEFVLVPVQAEYLALEGLGHLLETIERIRRGLNPDLQVLGLVMTMHDSRTNLARDVVAEVRRHFGEQVFATVIPRGVRLSEAPSYGEAILAYAPQSQGAVAYAALTREITTRLGLLAEAATPLAVEVSVPGADPAHPIRR
ncbi:MAG: ParA family protein [Anaerolineae bacterium]